MTDKWRAGLRKVRRLIGIARFAFAIPSQFVALERVPTRRFAMRWSDRWLCLRDATATTGFDRHYVFHIAWACRVLAEQGVRQHVDFASSLYFIASVSAFIPTHFFDYRPADLGLSGLKGGFVDLMRLPFMDNELQSVSCMHVVEHIGLGRYGDPLDYDGDMKAAAELGRVVRPGGLLLFVVPVGGEARIQFNAHRIYTHEQVLGLFPAFELVEFALVPDHEADGGLVRGATATLAAKQVYGCGCFHFRKRSP